MTIDKYYTSVHPFSNTNLIYIYLDNICCVFKVCYIVLCFIMMYLLFCMLLLEINYYYTIHTYSLPVQVILLSARCSCFHCKLNILLLVDTVF